MVVFTSLQPKGKDQQGGYQTCHDLSQSQLSISKMPHPPRPRQAPDTQKRQIPLFSGLHQKPPRCLSANDSTSFPTKNSTVHSSLLRTELQRHP